MEWKLYNTDLFDTNLKETVEDILTKEINKIDKSFQYKLSVIFNVKNLYDPQKEEFYKAYVEEKRRYPKKKGEDTIYDILTYQLDQVEMAFEKFEVSFYNADIIGRKLNEEEILIVLEEEKIPDEKRKIGKVRCIMGDEDFSKKRITSAVNEYYNKRFHDLLQAFGNKVLLAEFLEVDENAEEQELYLTYIEKYGDFFVTGEERMRKIEKFKERLSTFIDAYKNSNDNKKQ